MVMPFVVKALLDNRARYALGRKMGEAALFEKHPKARGYLRSRDGYRLFDKRPAVYEQLLSAVRKNADWLKQTLSYPIATPTAK